MSFSDGFFKRVEKKTNVNKDTILGLAKKLQENDLKNENTLREVIHELSQMTGREVSKDKEDKIVNAVVNDNVPKDIDKMFQNHYFLMIFSCFYGLRCAKMYNRW